MAKRIIRSSTPKGGRRKGKSSIGSYVGDGRYKSKLESYCARKLDELNIDYQYEGVSYQLLDSFKYKGLYYKTTAKSTLMKDRTGSLQLPISYTPDFVSVKHKFIIETKGFILSNHSFNIRWKLFIHYLYINNMSDYMVFMPKNQKQVDQVMDILQKHITHEKGAV